MKRLFFVQLLIVVAGNSASLLAQGNCPVGYTKSPLQAKIYFLGGSEVTDVVEAGQIYYLKIKPINAVLSLYPSIRAVNIGVQIAGYSSTASGFTIHNRYDTSASDPFTDAVVQSGVGPDVGEDQTAVFVIKINSDNYDGQISFNGGYYMCVDYYDSNSLPVYKVMPVKLLTAP